MKQKPLHFLALCAFCFFLAGCVSTYRPGGKTAALQGMVYDYDNSPVSGYRIRIDGEKQTYTDINGRFSFPDIVFGMHDIKGSGERHISFEQNCEFSDKTAILHIRIPSHEAVYVLIDSALEKRDTHEARRLLGELPREEQETAAWRLYSAIERYLDAGPIDGDCWLEQAERASALLKGGLL